MDILLEESLGLEELLFRRLSLEIFECERLFIRGDDVAEGGDTKSLVCGEGVRGVVGVPLLETTATSSMSSSVASEKHDF